MNGTDFSTHRPRLPRGETCSLCPFERHDEREWIAEHSSDLAGANTACFICGRDIDEEPHKDGCPNDPKLFRNKDDDWDTEYITLQHGPDPEEADRINVDFDNTLTQDNVEYWNGERPEPDEAMVAWVNEQYNSGKTIIIWTARQWGEAGRVVGHLTEWGVKYHGIRCNKGSADCYVDDCAVHPEQIKSNQ